MQYEICDTTYWIDEYKDGWGWSSKHGEGCFFYSEPYMALEDAIDQVQNRINEEMEVFNESGNLKPQWVDEDWQRECREGKLGYENI